MLCVDRQLGAGRNVRDELFACDWNGLNGVRLMRDVDDARGAVVRTYGFQFFWEFVGLETPREREAPFRVRLERVERCEIDG